jgi:NAD-dependent SIR2 family protein deacetylase
MLKPDVVFFGDGIPQHRSLKALALVEECDLLLAIGEGFYKFAFEF